MLFVYWFKILILIFSFIDFKIVLRSNGKNVTLSEIGMENYIFDILNDIQMET